VPASSSMVRRERGVFGGPVTVPPLTLTVACRTGWSRRRGQRPPTPASVTLLSGSRSPAPAGTRHTCGRRGSYPRTEPFLPAPVVHLRRGAARLRGVVSDVPGGISPRLRDRQCLVERAADVADGLRRDASISNAMYIGSSVSASPRSSLLIGTPFAVWLSRPCATATRRSP
jgi:hypothetical protein